ncbi:MAG: hypothetical protein K2R98_15100 [Gemmataceae bacterium]|nr:hypothetical protein [Gemmataceae bacterium]
MLAKFDVGDVPSGSWRHEREDRLAFSPNGKILAGLHHGKTLYKSSFGSSIPVGYSGEIWLWETDTGRMHQRIPVSTSVSSLMFSPDGKTLEVAGTEWYRVNTANSGIAASYRSGTVSVLYDAATGKERSRTSQSGEKPVLRPFDPHLAGLRYFRLSADRKTIARYGSGCAIYLCDPVTGKEKTVRPGHDSWVTDLAFSADSRTVASASVLDGAFRVWDARSGKHLSASQLPAQTDAFHVGNGLSFSPDGGTLAVDNTFWEQKTGKQLANARVAVDTSRGRLRASTFSPDGKTFAFIAGSDQEQQLGVCRWDGENTSSYQDLTYPKDRDRRTQTTIVGCVFLDPATLASAVQSTAFGRTSPFIPEAARDDWRWKQHGTLVWWDTSTAQAKQCREFQLPTSASNLAYLAVSSDGRAVAGLLTEQSETTPPEFSYSWIIAETYSGREVCRVAVGKRTMQDYPRSAAFSPDGKLLAWGTQAGSIHLYDLGSGQELARFAASPSSVVRLVFSPDNELLASFGHGTEVLMWDVAAVVAAKRPRNDLSAEAFAALWSDLADRDAAVAWRSTGTLSASGEHVVPFLKKRLRPAEPVDPRLIDRLIGDLDSPQFQVRQAAVAELSKLGRPCLLALKRVLDRQPALEVRRRVESLLDEIGKQPPFSVEQLRRLRAIQVLERNGSTEARALLEAMGKGDPDAFETADARRALARLSFRARR